MTVSVRVPQEERSRAMRARLMDATIECLVERGFGGTSTTLISQRAGVSRGTDREQSTDDEHEQHPTGPALQGPLLR